MLFLILILRYLQDDEMMGGCDAATARTGRGPSTGTWTGIVGERGGRMQSSAARIIIFQSRNIDQH